MTVKNNYLPFAITFSVLLSLSFQKSAIAYNIGDAITQAKILNEGFEIIEKDLKIQKLVKDRAMSGFLPKIIAQSTINQNDPAIPTTNVPGSLKSYKQNSLTVTQELFHFGNTLASLKAAKNDIKSAEMTYREKFNELLLQVIEVYQEVRSKRNQMQLALEREKIAHKILTQAEFKFYSGTITKTEVSKAKAELAGALANKAKAIGELKGAEAKYLYSVGELPPEELQAINIEALSVTEDYEPFIDKVTNINPSVIRTKSDWEREKNNLHVAETSLLPTISFQGQFTRYDGIESKPKGIIPSNLVNSNTYSFSVTAPIFQQGLEYANLKEAKYKAEKSKSLYFNTVSNANSKAVLAWNNYNFSQANITSNIESIHFYEESFNGVTEEFKHGTKTLTELLQTQDQLFFAKQSLIDREKDLVVSAFSIKALADELIDINFSDISLKTVSMFKNAEIIDTSKIDM